MSSASGTVFSYWVMEFMKSRVLGKVFSISAKVWVYSIVGVERIVSVVGVVIVLLAAAAMGVAVSVVGVVVVLLAAAMGVAVERIVLLAAAAMGVAVERMGVVVGVEIVTAAMGMAWVSDVHVAATKDGGFETVIMFPKEMVK